MAHLDDFALHAKIAQHRFQHPRVGAQRVGVGNVSAGGFGRRQKIGGGQLKRAARTQVQRRLTGPPGVGAPRCRRPFGRRALGLTKVDARPIDRRVTDAIAEIRFTPRRAAPVGAPAPTPHIAAQAQAAPSNKPKGAPQGRGHRYRRPAETEPFGRRQAKADDCHQHRQNGETKRHVGARDSAPRG